MCYLYYILKHPIFTQKKGASEKAPNPFSYHAIFRSRILVLNPVSRASSNGNPRSRKTYWGLSSGRESLTGAGRLQECKKIQSLYRSREKRGSVKAIVSRTVHSRECPFGKLPLYNYYFF